MSWWSILTDPYFNAILISLNAGLTACNFIALRDQKPALSQVAVIGIGLSVAIFALGLITIPAWIWGTR